MVWWIEIDVDERYKKLFYCLIGRLESLAFHTFYLCSYFHPYKWDLCVCSEGSIDSKAEWDNYTSENILIYRALLLNLFARGSGKATHTTVANRLKKHIITFQERRKPKAEGIFTVRFDRITRAWKRDLADAWIERKAEILKMFMDWHCMRNFWLSHVRLCKVMPLLQNVLSDSMDKHKWKLISCKDRRNFLHPFCCCPLLLKMYRNFPGYRILWLLVLLQSQLLWQFLLSLLPNLFLLAYMQK